jgi:hypothetical protein
MDAKIVVDVAITADVEEVISCCELLARPGMTVILLLRSPLEPWAYIRDHWITAESVRAVVAQGKRNLARYSLPSEQELAEGKFAPVREALGKRGVAVQIDLFTGSLQQKLQEYSADARVSWIVRHAGSQRPLSRFLDRMLARFRSLRSGELVPSWSLLRVAYRRGTRGEGLLGRGNRTRLPLA